MYCGLLRSDPRRFCYAECDPRVRIVLCHMYSIKPAAASLPTCLAAAVSNTAGTEGSDSPGQSQSQATAAADTQADTQGVAAAGSQGESQAAATTASTEPVSRAVPVVNTGETTPATETAVAVTATAADPTETKTATPLPVADSIDLPTAADDTADTTTDAAGQKKPSQEEETSSSVSPAPRTPTSPTPSIVKTSTAPSVTKPAALPGIAKTATATGSSPREPKKMHKTASGGGFSLFRNNKRASTDLQMDEEQPLASYACKHIGSEPVDKTSGTATVQVGVRVETASEEEGSSHAEREERGGDI